MKKNTPYNDEKETKDIIVRTFSADIEESELVWHYDKQDRCVEVIKNDGDWMFQYDNQLPFILNNPIYIKKGLQHRLIKGKTKGDLVLRIINDKCF